MEKNEVRYEAYSAKMPTLSHSGLWHDRAYCANSDRTMRAFRHSCRFDSPDFSVSFPYHAFDGIVDRVKAFLSVEMSMGQMVDDVKLAIAGKKPVFSMGVPAA